MNENTGGIHVHERSAELHERHHGKPCNRDRDVRFRVFAQQWRGSVGQTIYAAFPTMRLTKAHACRTGTKGSLSCPP